MPNLPISQLPAANALTGPELFATVQDGITKQTTFDAIYTGLTGSFVSSSTFNNYTSSVQSYYLSAYHTASIPLSVININHFQNLFLLLRQILIDRPHHHLTLQTHPFSYNHLELRFESML